MLDTNVVASALLWGGVPGRLLRSARDRQVRLFTSMPLLAELADILLIVVCPEWHLLSAVMPAKAGIQRLSLLHKRLKSLDSSFRWNDEPREFRLK